MDTLNPNVAIAILKPKGKPKMLKLKDLPNAFLVCGYTLRDAVKLATSEARKHQVTLHNVSAAFGYLQQLVWHVSSFNHKNGRKALEIMAQAIQEHGNVVTHEYSIRYGKGNSQSPLYVLAQGEDDKKRVLKELRALGHNPQVDNNATKPVFDI